MTASQRFLFEDYDEKTPSNKFLLSHLIFPWLHSDIQKLHLELLRTVTDCAWSPLARKTTYNWQYYISSSIHMLFPKMLTASIGESFSDSYFRCMSVQRILKNNWKPVRKTFSKLKPLCKYISLEHEAVENVTNTCYRFLKRDPKSATMMEARMSP